MGCAQSTAAHGVEDPQPEVQQITPAVEPIVQPQHLAALAPSAALKVSKVKQTRLNIDTHRSTYNRLTIG